jgi:dienelactone hydrolase
MGGRKTKLTMTCLAGCLFIAAPASAKIPASLYSPGNCDRTVPATGYAVYKCDDGVPDFGGTTPNPTGAKAVTVPARYGGNGYTGLPGKTSGGTSVPGADSDGNIALDVDVTLPSVPAPQGGYPMLVFMHGCCSGNKTSWEATTFDGPDTTGSNRERWHYNNAWFAARGYVVVNYTARGFVDSNNHGSTGQTELDSRRYEINDYQHLACQVLGAASKFGQVNGGDVAIDPRRVVTTGGSYGGGFSWLALTDPKWTCTSDTGAEQAAMSLAATAPKYGWTDLVYSLVPTGNHLQEPGALPAFNGCDSGPRKLDGTVCPSPLTPVGIPKKSIVAGLYATGKAPGTNHTTFPSKIDDAFTCLTSAYPPESNPACTATVNAILPEFLRDRSAYYQNGFFQKIASDPGYRIPVFNAATLTDPLFPASENRTMLNRLRTVVPNYPIKAFYGDYQHFTQNKATEWADICDSGTGRHPCAGPDDYPTGDYNSASPNLVRTGITSRLNRFIDRYARPPGDPNQPTPTFNVNAELQICPQNADGRPADEPGPIFTAPTFEQLAPNTLELNLAGTQVTTSDVEPNPHAAHSDPVANLAANGGKCPVETQPAGSWVAVYTSTPLATAATMIGATKVTAHFSASPGASGVELNARLYDVFPDGAVMVDRGPRRVSDAEVQSGSVTYELHGNGWRFKQGHRIRIELAQDDDPFLKSSSVPSSLTLTGVNLAIPVR